MAFPNPNVILEQLGRVISSVTGETAPIGAPVPVGSPPISAPAPNGGGGGGLLDRLKRAAEAAVNDLTGADDALDAARDQARQAEGSAKTTRTVALVVGVAAVLGLGALLLFRK